MRLEPRLAHPIRDDPRLGRDSHDASVTGNKIDFHVFFARKTIGDRTGSPTECCKPKRSLFSRVENPAAFRSLVIVAEHDFLYLGRDAESVGIMHESIYERF